MPDTPTSNTVTSAAPSAAATGTAGESVHTAHLQNLKKMSTTAGLGSGDYAAVSPLAVVAVVIGLLGGLAFLSDFLLPVPAAALICGIIALRQIRRSNGTQTGLVLAIVGILLGGGVFGTIVGGHVITELRTKPDKEQIQQVFQQLDAACAKQDYHAAYQLFAPSFRERVSEEQFIHTMSARGGPIAAWGAMQHVAWNNEIIFADTPEGAPKLAFVGGEFRFEHLSELAHQQLDFIEINGKWMIRDVGTLFPVKQQGR